MGNAKSWGVMMMFLGAGSFLLPLIGLQFRILSIFGKSQWIVGLFLIVIGGLLLFVPSGNKIVQ